MGLLKYTHPKYYAKRATNWEYHEHRAKRDGASGLGALIGILLVIAVFFAVMWPLSLWGHALHLTPSWHQLMNRNHTWMHAHYPLVGLRYIGAALLLILLLIGTGLGLRSALKEVES